MSLDWHGLVMYDFRWQFAKLVRFINEPMIIEKRHEGVTEIDRQFAGVNLRHRDTPGDETWTVSSISFFP